MRRLWSEQEKRRLWRQIWIALAQAEAEFDIVRPEQVDDLRLHADEIDIPRALALEAEIRHDLMAELKTYAAQCPIGGGILHLGATSMDIEDNADALRLAGSLDLILGGLEALLEALAGQIERWAGVPAMAFTHLQPAEPTTIGYRLAFYAQDLLVDWEALRAARAYLRGKGFKGAVGTAASFAALVGPQNLEAFEARIGELLGLGFFPVTGQTAPRKQEYQILSALAGLGGSLYKFAFDLRVLQSAPLGEASEPFGARQIGSSAMPFKRNPIQSEKIDSLARALAQAPRLAWDNAAHSLLERTLDDSANRRTLLPEAFLAADELVGAATRIIAGLNVDERAVARNLDAYGPFAATEPVMMALVKAGADRQEMHARLRELSLAAWEEVRAGRPNPLAERLCSEPAFLNYLSRSELEGLMDTRGYLGLAPERARSLAGTIRARLAERDA